MLTSLYHADGCCDSEFDSTYPIHLNGIIPPAEFDQSIRNINRSKSYKLLTCVIVTIAIAVFVLAIVLVIVGTVMARASESYRSFPWIGGSTGLFVLFGIISGVGGAVLDYYGFRKMRKAVARESAKYSQATPIPCSWRIVKRRRGCCSGCPISPASYNASDEIWLDVLIIVSLSI